MLLSEDLSIDFSAQKWTLLMSQKQQRNSQNTEMRRAIQGGHE